MASVGTFDSVISAGAESIEVSEILGTPTGYSIYDVHGLIASDDMDGNSVTIPAPNGAWPPGYALILFTGAWSGTTGYVADSIQILAIRDGIGQLPPVPAVGTLPAPAAADPNGRGIDQYMHGFALVGPQRWQIRDSANPTVPGSGSEQGSTVAGIAAGIAADQGDAGMVNPAYADAARPRPEFVTFPNGQASESGYAAGVQAAVEALGPGTASDVTYFEGLNEPNGSNGLSQAQSGANYNAFRAAVKAGNPNALAMGPAEVAFGPDGSETGSAAITEFLDAVTPGTLDVFSVHDYNAYNGDFLITDAYLGAIRTALATAGYPADLPMFFTETGSIFDAWNLFSPRHLIQWISQLYLTAERWGMPKEHIYWFYDTAIPGFDISWLKEDTGDMRPTVTFLRVYAEEIWGKVYASALEFGAIGSVFYRGNVYRGSDGTCVSLVAQGNVGDTVELAVSDTGSVSVSDWQGQVTNLTVVDGRLTVPICDLPVYLRLSADCTVSVVDVGNGVMDATNIAGAATASCSSMASDVDLVNNGEYEIPSYYGVSAAPFASRSPDSIVLEWDTPQVIGKVMLRQCAPWVDVYTAAMTEGRLEYWNGSGWLPCPTVAGNHWDRTGRYENTTAHATLGQVGGQTTLISFYDQHWCHNVDLEYAITTTKLRLTVTQAGTGEIPDEASLHYSYNTGVLGEAHQFTIGEILVIESQTPGDTGITYAPVVT
jgi:hypothetical protein